jgi:hypothetical protein
MRELLGIVVYFSGRRRVDLLYRKNIYKASRGSVIWLVMLITTGLGLSRRELWNRGSIDSGREEGRN